MKKLFVFACLILLSSFLTALGQSTTILPGTILPQMTTAQRTAIASPQNGMLVFDTNTQSYWFRQSGTWVNLSAGGGGSSYWQLNGAGGNEIKNTNTGGFWSANPTGLTYIPDNITNPPTAPVSGAGTRLMWIPSRSAFRVGTVVLEGSNNWDANNIGLFSFATGVNTRASGSYSTAMGVSTTASGYYSTAIGQSTTAIGANSTAMGFYNAASGDYSTAMGQLNSASGNTSTAIGKSTYASGDYSTAIGFGATASGIASTAMGESTTASGNGSTAMGESTTASGNGSTAMGESTTAGGNGSTAMGFGATASGIASTAMGYNTTASGTSSIAMGYNTTASGNGSIAMGEYTTASGYSSTAMGSRVNANGKEGSLAIGDIDPYTQGTTHVGFPNQFVARFANGYYLMTCGNTNYPPTGVRTGIWAGAGANAWSAISDSTKKEKHQPIDGEGLLHKIAKFKLTTWNYKGQGPKVFRHYGPMAQDFYAAFGKDGFGTIGCDTLINQADFDGINFAAIQALVKRTNELRVKSDKLSVVNDELRMKNEALEDRLAKMEKEWVELRQMLTSKTTENMTATAK